MRVLTDLEFLPYLDSTGNISGEFTGKIGLYGIFDQQYQLQYVGISRDIATSLKLHLVRVPQLCHWLKVETIAKPSRTALLAMQSQWRQQCVSGDLELWEQPLNCHRFITDAEKAAYANTMNESEQSQVLKNLARRIEQEILQQLAERGIGFEVRFNPKLKGLGILDLKP